MKTLLLNTTQIEEASHILLEGGILAIPTDTVYGLAVCYNNLSAIKKLRQVKQRPEDKPFAIMVSSLEMIESMAVLSKRDKEIIKKCLPGDLTLIFNKRKDFKSEYFQEMTSIAFRIPNESFILKLIESIKTGLLVPSANISGATPCVDSEEVIKVFDGLIEGIVIGRSGQQEASTIVDATQKHLRVVRQGRMTLEEIERKARVTI